MSLIALLIAHNRRLPSPPLLPGAAAPGGAARSGTRAACAAAGTVSRRATTMTASHCPSTDPSGRRSRRPSARGAHPPGPARPPPASRPATQHCPFLPELLFFWAWLPSAPNHHASAAPVTYMYRRVCSGTAAVQEQAGGEELEERCRKSRACEGSIVRGVKRMERTVGRAGGLVICGSGSNPKHCRPLS